VELRDLLNRAVENISVSRAFGSAYEKDGVLVIPVALVAGGGGGGEGPTTWRNASRDEEGTATFDEPREGTGSGGGFGGVVVPVGAYVVKDQQVRWVPAVNATVIVLAVLCAIRLVTKSRVKVQRLKHG
jgi:uncharacterized spore protein YtfJ